MRRIVRVRPHRRRTLYGYTNVKRHNRQIQSRYQSHSSQYNHYHRPVYPSRPIFKREFNIGHIKTKVEIDKNGAQIKGDLLPFEGGLSFDKGGLKVNGKLNVDKDKSAEIEKNLLTGTKKVILRAGDVEFETPPLP
jgi:hypothetical protein